MIEKKLPLPNSVRSGPPNKDDERQFQEKFRIKKYYNFKILFFILWKNKLFLVLFD